MGMHEAIRAFQLAENGFSERVQARGILFDPALGVEAGLLAALPHLERIKADEGAVTYAVARKAYAALETEGDAIECMRKALIAVWPNPPAQADEGAESIGYVMFDSAVGFKFGLLTQDLPHGTQLFARHPAPVAQSELPTEMSPNAAASYRLGWRDALAAQPRAMPKLDAEDWAVLQRLRNALPDVGLNGWHRGVTVLSKLLAAAPSPGESS